MKTQMPHNQLGIVVGVDGSPSASGAIRWAVRDAALRNVPVTLVHMVTPAGPGAVPRADTQARLTYSAWEDPAHRIIAEARKIAAAATPAGRNPEIASEVRYSPTIPTLVDLSKHAELVVLGYQAAGPLPHALLRSVGYHMVRHAHCPVAVIHDSVSVDATPPPAPVVVGIDGSAISEFATAIAFDEAARRHVDLVGLHTWLDSSRPEIGQPQRAPIEWSRLQESGAEVLARRLSRWQERYPDVVVHKAVVRDRPTDRLLKLAETAQLLIVGSHGRGPAGDALLDSVSYRVLSSARTPVIVARTQDRHHAGSGSGHRAPEAALGRTA